jgi:hypothetical protein
MFWSCICKHWLRKSHVGNFVNTFMKDSYYSAFKMSHRCHTQIPCNESLPCPILIVPLPVRKPLSILSLPLFMPDFLSRLPVFHALITFLPVLALPVSLGPFGLCVPEPTTYLSFFVQLTTDPFLTPIFIRLLSTTHLWLHRTITLILLRQFFCRIVRIRNRKQNSGNCLS